MSDSVPHAIHTLALLTSLARYALRTTATAALSVGIGLLALVGATGAEIPLEGFGTATPGGSGRPEYVVTNLNDSGPGSLREAVSSGNKMVRFAVGGQINLTTGPIHVGGPFITIDGVTAPEPGITLDGAGLVLRGDLGAHHVIVRDLRIRNIRDDARGRQMDGIQISRGASNIVISHVSVWAGPSLPMGDGLIDITDGAHDVTVAWSILAGSGEAMLITSEPKRVSLHHNLWVGGKNRNPQVSVDNPDTPANEIANEITIDMWNNVVYDWVAGAGTAIHHGAWANVINNFYSSPDDARSDQEQALIVCQSGVCFSGLDPRANARAYTSGNVSGDPLSFDINSVGTETAPFHVGHPRTIAPACLAAKQVLREAGPYRFQRDAIDLQYLTPIDLAICRRTTTTLTTTAASSTLLGEPVAFTARVAAPPPAVGPPRGSVTFFRGAIPIGPPVPLVEGVVDSVATFTTDDLPPGTITVKAVYSGEPEEFDKSQVSLKHQVIGVLTETQLLPVSPSYVGRPVILTALVTAEAPSTATPVGSVRFYDGSKILAIKPLEAGRASLATSALPAGFRNVKAQFMGASGFGASNSTQTVQIDGGTVTRLGRNPSSARTGQAVTFTARVAALTVGDPVPGTVTFRDGTKVLGTVPLVGGTAVLTCSATSAPCTSSLAVGKHPVTASYDGISSRFEPSVSPVASTSVVRGGTKTVLTSSTQGGFVTFTAVVNPVLPAAGTPSGTVTFKDGAAIVATVNLSGGRAVSEVALGPGTHTISAAYSGSEEFNSSKVVVKVNR